MGCAVLSIVPFAQGVSVVGTAIVVCLVLSSRLVASVVTLTKLVLNETGSTFLDIALVGFAIPDADFILTLVVLFAIDRVGTGPLLGALAI